MQFTVPEPCEICEIVFSDHEYGFNWKEDLPSSSYYKLNTGIDSSKFGLTESRVKC